MSDRTAYFARLHCEKNGMQLYQPNSSPQARQALVTFAKSTLGNNKLIEVFVGGRSGDTCTALQGDGRLKNISCKSASLFVCEFLEPTTTTSCSVIEPIENIDLGDIYFFPDDYIGFTSPKICDYKGTISNGNTAMTVNAGAEKQSIIALLFMNNPNVAHFPIDLASNFPNLLAIFSAYCQISELSYRSFQGLSSLKNLFLGFNLISKLDRKVFKDLVNLKVLILSKLSNFH
jgi:hypothetical protein